MFAAATRPGFELGEEALRVLRERTDSMSDPSSCRASTFPPASCASACAEGRTIRYLVPEAVREIIEEESVVPKGEPTMADWRSEAFYKERRDELEKRVGPRRFKHSLGVSETAEELARVYGADETAARVAGLLHDWDKGYDDPGILARADELGMELDAELVRHAPRPAWPHRRRGPGPRLPGAAARGARRRRAPYAWAMRA